MLSRVSGERNVEIYKVVTEGPYIYLAMELVEGETLQQRVESEGPLTGTLLWFTAQGLVEALKAIHEAGITHRDLKPSNIMFGPDGVKVLDFGISAVAEETGLTQTGTLMGTAAWISPEQILGRDITEKCDIFNLGLVLAYAATGKHPYGEGRPEAIMYRMSSLDSDLEGIPEPLQSAINRCLEKEPEKRPSVEELATFFASSGEEKLPDLPDDSTFIITPSVMDRIAETSKGGSGEHPLRPEIKNPRQLGALLILALIGGGLWFLLSQDSEEEAQEAAVIENIDTEVSAEQAERISQS